MFSNIDYGKNVVQKYIDFNPNSNLPLSEQEDEWLLKEDLIQISYSNGLVLDVGWHPEFNPEGSFVVQVVRDDAWQKPLVRIECRELNSLMEQVKHSINYIQNQL